MKGTTIKLSAIGGDFDVCASLFDGWPIRLNSIQWNPAADNNKLVIKDGSATGPDMYNLDSLSGQEKIQYYQGAYKEPFIDYSDCTLNATDIVIINTM